jgi:hypothetical protein
VTDRLLLLFCYVSLSQIFSSPVEESLQLEISRSLEQCAPYQEKEYTEEHIYVVRVLSSCRE